MSNILFELILPVFFLCFILVWLMFGISLIIEDWFRIMDRIRVRREHKLEKERASRKAEWD